MQLDGVRIRAIDLEGVAGAAQRLGVSRRRMYQMIDEGKIDYYQFGKRRMLRKRDIDRLIDVGWEGKRKRETG